MSKTKTTITHSLLDRLNADADATARRMIGQPATLVTMRGNDPRIPAAARRFIAPGRSYAVLYSAGGKCLLGAPVDDADA